MSTLPQIVDGQSSDGSAGLAALSALGGKAFLEGLAAWLRESLNLYAVSIGDRAGDLGHLVQMRAYACREADDRPISYALVGTPCRDVMSRDQPLCLPRQVTVEYPHDAMFRDLGIESYIGVPLHNPSGRAIGLLCVFDTRAMEAPGQVLELLEWLAPRVGRELFVMRQQEQILASVNWFGQPDSDAVFANLAQALATVMQISTCVVTEWLNEDPDHYRVVACHHAGQVQAELTGALWRFDQSPCADLRGGPDSLLVANALARRWPDSPLVTLCSANSCFAAKLRDRAGETLGHLILGHVREIDPRVAHEPGLILYRTRAAAELERIRLDEERQQLTDALMSKQKLESLGLMAGGIAHDFNNLLVAILGNVNLAAEHTGARGAAYLGKVETAAMRAGDILRQLLEFTGKGCGEAEPVDLSDAVRTAAELLTLSTSRNATTRYELADDLPPTLVDAIQLQQVIINLVLNASEALDDKAGVIAIRTGRVQLDQTRIARLTRGRDLEPGEYLLLEVTDTGSGMDRGTMERIFDPFFTSKPTGRGLGLSALQGFARAYHCGIGVNSAPSEGTCMQLFLPPGAGRARTHAAEAPNRSEAVHIDRPILVVDDDDDVRAVTAELLHSLEYGVHACANGESAVASYRDGNFAAAFIDISMPGLDGWSTMAELRQIDPDLPVIMMSGYTQLAAASMLARERRAGFLKKPFRRDDLRRALAQAVLES